jgi:hypothetical protein
MDTQKQLLIRIEAFIGHHKMAETTFGLRSVNDGKFVRRLREEANMTTSTLAKAEAFLVAQSLPKTPESDVPPVEARAQAVA